MGREDFVYDREDEGEEKIAHGASEGDQCAVAPGGAEIVGIKLDWSAPAEAEYEQHDRAERVQVGAGIQGEAAQGTGRGVTQGVGCPGVGVLVDRDGQDERDRPDDEEEGIGKESREHSYLIILARTTICLNTCQCRS